MLKLYKNLKKEEWCMIAVSLIFIVKKKRQGYNCIQITIIYFQVEGGRYADKYNERGFDPRVSRYFFG